MTRQSLAKLQAELRAIWRRSITRVTCFDTRSCDMTLSKPELIAAGLLGRGAPVDCVGVNELASFVGVPASCVRRMITDRRLIPFAVFNAPRGLGYFFKRTNLETLKKIINPTTTSE